MSLRPTSCVPLWFSVVVLSACVSAVVPAAATALHQDTVRLEGWFSARGEWTLFATPDFRNYNPYVQEEDKCVSLINATGSPRSTYQALHGKKVVVVGVAVRYDDLASGNSAADRLLSKKYFNNDVVENYCLRDLVFAVSSIREEN
jgi:hypothetical protein